MELPAELRKNGYRITPARTAVYRAISPLPKSPEEIFRELTGSGTSIDLASVYRNIRLFLKFRLIREVDFRDGKRRYELRDNKKHHHHLVCEDCKAVEDVPLDENILLSQIEKLSKFKIARHELEFFGHCINCQ